MTTDNGTEAAGCSFSVATDRRRVEVVARALAQVFGADPDEVIADNGMPCWGAWGDRADVVLRALHAEENAGAAVAPASPFEARILEVPVAMEWEGLDFPPAPTGSVGAAVDAAVGEALLRDDWPQLVPADSGRAAHYIQRARMHRLLLAAAMASVGWRWMPVEATEAQHVAARDWSAKKYGKSIGIDASRGCWGAMAAAAPDPFEQSGWPLRKMLLALGSASVSEILFRVARQRSAMETAADLFQAYADEHRAAGKDEKAQRNQAAAEALRAAMGDAS
ncbi:MAG TPA: hypothetical protein VMV33_17295 [Rhodocyclaceae bacterium]|nr:hypothetical protein [Rhodocyclaceae bacterium]